MNIEQQVRQEIDEFGDRAHECFILTAHGFGEQNKNNGTLLHILEHDKYLQHHDIQLKPLSGLFEHDVKIYGAYAYLMWEFLTDTGKYATPFDNDGCAYQIYKNDYASSRDCRRKTSCALPFDLERAKAGDAVGFLRNGEWVDFDSCGCKVNWDYPDVDYSDYKMKYPKKAAK